MEEVSGYALQGIGWQDRREGWGIGLGGCHTVAVMTVCPCGSDGWGYAWPEGRFCMCSHGGHALVRRMKDGEDMLAEGGWDDCVCFVKYYGVHCV